MNHNFVDYYTAEILSASDYDPFGMQLDDRKVSSSTYRYGFNGKENDNDVKGDGNQQDYGFRIYDPRVGRFLSVDPLTKSYPWNSTYAFAENSPIANIDLDGLESKIAVYQLNNENKVVVTVWDGKKLLLSSNETGLTKYQKITEKEFFTFKSAIWVAYSNQKKLFSSGFTEYTLGEQNNKNSFTGKFEGTLHIIKQNGSPDGLMYDPTNIIKPTSVSWGEIWKDMHDPKSRTNAALGSAKNLVAGISLALGVGELIEGGT